MCDSWHVQGLYWERTSAQYFNNTSDIQPTQSWKLHENLYLLLLTMILLRKVFLLGLSLSWGHRVWSWRWIKMKHNEKHTFTHWWTDMHDYPLLCPAGRVDHMVAPAVHFQKQCMTGTRKQNEKKKNVSTYNYFGFNANCCILYFDIWLFSIFQMFVNI